MSALSTIPRCTGHCRQGRAACSCETRQRIPAEACTELGADTSAPALSFWRRLLIARVQWQIGCLTSEREHYQSLGWVGPIYLRESYAQQIRLMQRIRKIQEPAPRRQPLRFAAPVTLMLALASAIGLVSNRAGGPL